MNDRWLTTFDTEAIDLDFCGLEQPDMEEDKYLFCSNKCLCRWAGQNVPLTVVSESESSFDKALREAKEPGSE